MSNGIRDAQLSVEDPKRRYVIVTSKGDAFVTFNFSPSLAITAFQKRWPGLEVASCFEATEF